jgi:hypothetical protein
VTKYLAGAVVEEVHLAPRVHRHYRAIAERNGCSVVDLLSEALRRIATAHPDLQQPDPQPVVQVERPARRPANREHTVRWQPRWNDVVREGNAEGMTDAQIAARLGATYQQVYYHRTRLGLPSTRAAAGAR